jgi:hypothetical protein
MREFLGDSRLDCLCGRDVGIAAASVALVESGKPAAIEGGCQLRIEAK